MNATKLTVSVQGSLLNILRSLGEPAAVIPAALRQYTVDRCLQRIDEAESRAAVFAARYEADYATFNRRVTTDQAYLDALNQENPLWEADAIEWIHRLEEAQAWRDHLQTALQTSLLSLAPD